MKKTLFRTSRPYLRPLVESDLGYLWAAYQRGAFPLPPELSNDGFAAAIQALLAPFTVLAVDDDNPSFRSGRGIVGLVCCLSDGWTLTPQALVFPWATPKNVLRGYVALFAKLRHDRTVGCVVVQVTQPKLLRRMARYGGPYLRGRIPFGHPDGPLYVFSMSGKKDAAHRTDGTPAGRQHDRDRERTAAAGH